MTKKDKTVIPSGMTVRDEYGGTTYNSDDGKFLGFVRPSRDSDGWEPSYVHYSPYGKIHSRPVHDYKTKGGAERKVVKAFLALVHNIGDIDY